MGKLYKKVKHSGLENDKDNFKVAKMHLQKMILKEKKSYFEEELGKNRSKPKELWGSLGLSSDKTRQSRISLEKDGAIQFEVLENANTFRRFYSELAGSLQEKLPRAPNRFTCQITKNYYAKTSCNVSNGFEYSSVSEEDIKKILLTLDISKAGRDQIPVKCLSEFQSGCRTSHSRDLCLAQLTDFVATGMDKQLHTV